MAAVAGLWGGVEMYLIREAKRAAGDSLNFPWLWLERTVDFAFGAFTQAGLFALCVWFLAGLVEEFDVWIRQGLLLVFALTVFVLLNFFV